MKKIILIWFVVVWSFLLYSFLVTNTASVNSQKETIIVLSWSVKETIEVVGNVELVDEQQLSFNIVWTITEVNVKAGDIVKKWDVIAKIDNKDAVNNIKNAELTLQNAEISLQELYKWPDESNILQAKNTITKAEEWVLISQEQLEILKINQENTKNKALEDIENLRKDWDNSKADLEAMKKDLETAKNNLEISQKELELLQKNQNQTFNSTIFNQETTIKNIENTLKDYLAEVDTINTEADYILWVSETNVKKNDDFEIYLWAKNTNYKSQASSFLNQSLQNYKDLKKLVNSYDYSWNKDDLIEILDKVLNTYNWLYQMTDTLYYTIENSVEWTALPSSKITELKTKFSAYRSVVLTKISLITQAQNTIKNLSDTNLINQTNENAISKQNEAIKSAETAVSKQELAITKQELAISTKETDIKNAVKSYEELLTNQKINLTAKQNEVENAKKALEIAKTSYQELMDWATPENIEKASNAVKQAEIWLDNANKKLEDYELTAPFDGIIRKVDYMVWDNLKNDTNKYIYIENPDLIEIIVKLDQVDVVNVEVWDEAKIIFDAYSETSVSAKVSLVDSTPISNAWVISYEVKLVLDDWIFEGKLFSGMTSSVEMVMKQKDDVLILVDEAILEENWKYLVYVEKNWIEEKREVQVWLSGDWISEIISGLNEWDKVVYEVEEFELKINENMDSKMKEQEEMESQFNDIRMK